jgi:hypothetical protein
VVAACPAFAALPRRNASSQPPLAARIR